MIACRHLRLLLATPTKVTPANISPQSYSVSFAILQRLLYKERILSAVCIDLTTQTLLAICAQFSFIAQENQVIQPRSLLAHPVKHFCSVNGLLELSACAEHCFAPLAVSLCH